MPCMLMLSRMGDWQMMCPRLVTMCIAGCLKWAWARVKAIEEDIGDIRITSFEGLTEKVSDLLCCIQLCI